MKNKSFWVVCNGSGCLTIIPNDNRDYREKYKDWQKLIKVNRPVTDARVKFAFLWAVKTFGL